MGWLLGGLAAAGALILVASATAPTAPTAPWAHDVDLRLASLQVQQSELERQLLRLRSRVLALEVRQRREQPPEESIP